MFSVLELGLVRVRLFPSHSSTSATFCAQDKVQELENYFDAVLFWQKTS